jgi:hypothetical protein
VQGSVLQRMDTGMVLRPVQIRVSGSEDPCVVRETGKTTTRNFDWRLTIVARVAYKQEPELYTWIQFISDEFTRSWRHSSPNTILDSAHQSRIEKCRDSAMASVLI